MNYFLPHLGRSVTLAEIQAMNHDEDSWLEVDYARDLDDAPTFTEALAALDAWKTRRGV
jgi:hypothetical protein